MSHVLQMLESHPKDWGELDLAKLTECKEACFDCSQACTACADACLADDMGVRTGPMHPYRPGLCGCLRDNRHGPVPPRRF